MQDKPGGKLAEILLVEDEEADVNLVKLEIKKSKIKNTLHVARDGVEALDFLNKRNGFEDVPTPDIILLDLNMPRMNGKEVLEEIKSDPKLQGIPVVVMTSSDSEEDVARSYSLHANCYVRKPVDLSEFSKIVRGIECFWFSIVTLPPKES